MNLLGWSVAVKEWADPANAMAPSSRSLAGLTGLGALAATFAFLMVVLTIGAIFLGVNPSRFAPRFAILFALAFLCWVAGHNAHIAANPKKLPTGVGWGLGLTGEAGYLLALVGGLLIGNVFPKAAAWFKEAARPELFIKTGIVIYGAVLGAKAAEESGRAGRFCSAGWRRSSRRTWFIGRWST